MRAAFRLSGDLHLPADETGRMCRKPCSARPCAARVHLLLTVRSAEFPQEWWTRCAMRASMCSGSGARFPFTLSRSRKRRLYRMHRKMR